MKSSRIIVIGGGPAGLMAAGQAALGGASVLVLEKMKRAGLKLAITGKGRCNITNTAEIADFIGHFGRGGRFLRQPFSRFFREELLAFFEGRSLELTTERGGRIFPTSGNAGDVVNTLINWARECGVETKKNSPVSSLVIEKGRVTGVVTKGKTLPCDAVILATGGASYPNTGSTGDGYRLAESAGHTIVPIRPALVPLETAGGIAERMAGLELRNVGVRLTIDGKRRATALGEIGFTKYGVNGAVINTISGEVVDALGSSAEISISIDLKPALDDKKLDLRLQRDFKERATEPMNSILRGLVPALMVPVCLEMTGIASTATGNSITAKERRRLRTWLKDLRLKVTGHRPIEEAIVTAGGVATKEIDPRSMESRLTKRLYIVGELLDIAGDTGGYNLQAAFSTGWLAGVSAAEK